MKRESTFREKYCVATQKRDIARKNLSRERYAVPSRPYEGKNECRKRKKALYNTRDVNESPGTSRVSWPKAKL